MVEHRIKHQGRVISYRVKRVKGISYIRVRVNRNGVFVTAPKSASQAEIKRFLLSNADKIIRMIERTAPVIKKFADGEAFPYLGTERALRLMERPGARGIKVEATQRRIVVSGPPGLSADRIRAALVEWYREEARILLSNKVYFYAERMRLKPGRIAIRDQKTRWGSCSSRGNLNFSWRLIMMPEHIVDYVVVHELSHIRHRNHGKEFWALVGSVLPDYTERRDWLKQNGGRFRW